MARAKLYRPTPDEVAKMQGVIKTLKRKQPVQPQDLKEFAVLVEKCLGISPPEGEG